MAAKMTFFKPRLSKTMRYRLPYLIAKYNIILAVVLYGCNVGKANTATADFSKQEKLDNLQDYLAEGVVLDTERPYHNVLSEQEVLMKAADYAVKEGVLDPDYYVYKLDPALMTAKIEVPILEHLPDGTPGNYRLTAVDKSGAGLMDVHVNYKVNANDEKFVFLRLEPLPYRDERNNSHVITKREVQAFVKERFPDKQISDPMAINSLRLEGSPLSNMNTFWYFRTEEGSARSGQPVVDEYLIDMHIVGYKPLDKQSNRSVITAYRGTSLSDGYRMIKLTTPLYTSFKTDFTGRSINDTGAYRSAEPLKYVGVPLE